MRNVYLITAFVAVLVVSILGFRDSTFTKPPKFITKFVRGNNRVVDGVKL